MLPKAKQLLTRVQQAVVAVQVRDHAALRPACSRCGASCHVKDWQSRQVATLFGTVVVRLSRFRCPGCGRSETGVSWPAYCRSTPELDQLQAHLSALLTYRVAAGVPRPGRATRPCAVARWSLASSCAALPLYRPSRRWSRQHRHWRSRSAWTPRSSAAATTASDTWRCASAMLRHPRAAADRCSAPSRTPTPTSWC